MDVDGPLGPHPLRALAEIDPVQLIGRMTANTMSR